MLEYTMQTIFLFSVLFVYMLNGSIVYSATGEGYKATPLRCFAIGVAGWVLLVLLSSVFFTIKLEILWWGYVVLTLVSLFLLPKKDQTETFDKEFFLQVLTSFIILLPVFIFLSQDKLHFWQEFAIYGKGLFTLLNENYITGDLLGAPIAYPLAILPVGYFTELQDSIFACFNFTIIAFVACEFVRNSGVKTSVGNIVFPLVVAFALLIVLNPFSVKEFMLSADPFIFIGAVGFAFSEYIFRRGHLPKNVAAIPPALILMLLAFSSTQGFLLSVSLFLVLTIRYIIQFNTLNFKQWIGYLLMPLLTIFIICLWQFYLSKKGMAFLLFDFSKISVENISLFYKAVGVLLKEHILEVVYVAVILCLGFFRFSKVKKIDEIIVDRTVLRTVFWIIISYMFICVPIFFSQYEYIARASYSLGFTTLSLIQFIILMPVGRIIKDLLDKMEIEVSGSVKFTIIAALLVVFVMNKNYLQLQQNPRVENMQSIAVYLQENLNAKSKVAVVDVKKTAKFYEYILDYKNNSNLNIVSYSSGSLKHGLKVVYDQLRQQNVDYILLHAPNNLLHDKIEYNLNPNYTYLYKITPEGFNLIKKFKNAAYVDTNILIK